MYQVVSRFLTVSFSFKLLLVSNDVYRINLEKVTNGQNTMLLHAAGTVRYQQERIRCFTETFIITQVKTETGDVRNF